MPNRMADKNIVLFEQRRSLNMRTTPTLQYIIIRRLTLTDKRLPDNNVMNRLRRASNYFCECKCCSQRSLNEKKNARIVSYREIIVMFRPNKNWSRQRLRETRFKGFICTWRPWLLRQRRIADLKHEMRWKKSNKLEFFLSDPHIAKSYSAEKEKKNNSVASKSRR